MAADNKRNLRILKIHAIRENAIKDLGVLTERDMFMIGIALYAAEGTKLDRMGAFANSDPRIIKFMIEWLIKFAKVPPVKLRGAIWLHEGLDEDNAKKFGRN